MVGLNEYINLLTLELTKLLNQNIINTREIAEEILKYKDKNIFLLASGRSLLVLKMFGVRLRQLGFNVFYLLDELSPKISNEDLVLVLSGSGNTKIVVDSLKAINANTLCITANENGKILNYCNKAYILKGIKTKEIVYSNIFEKIFPMGSLFEIVALLILENVVSNLLELTNKNIREGHKILI